MNELGNTPADKNYKPSGIVNNLDEGQIKAVQLLNGTYITDKLAKSMTRAESFAMQYGYYDKEKKRACCVGYNAGYEQAEKDISALIESIIEGILGDAQPKPILRAELQELIERIKEEQK